MDRIGTCLVLGSNIEAATIEQAAHASCLPFVARHLALMPDAHVNWGRLSAE